MDFNNEFINENVDVLLSIGESRKNNMNKPQLFLQHGSVTISTMVTRNTAEKGSFKKKRITTEKEVTVKIFDKPTKPSNQNWSVNNNLMGTHPVKMAFWDIPTKYILEPSLFDSEIMYPLTGLNSHSVSMRANNQMLQETPQARLSTFFPTVPKIFQSIEMSLQEWEPRIIYSKDKSVAMKFEWLEKEIFCYKCGCKGHSYFQCQKEGQIDPRTKYPRVFATSKNAKIITPPHSNINFNNTNQKNDGNKKNQNLQKNKSPMPQQPKSLNKKDHNKSYYYTPVKNNERTWAEVAANQNSSYTVTHTPSQQSTGGDKAKAVSSPANKSRKQSPNKEATAEAAPKVGSPEKISVEASNEVPKNVGNEIQADTTTKEKESVSVPDIITTKEPLNE